MHAVHARLQELLAPHGAHIDDFFFSPWHAEGTVPPWNRAHEDRKPGLGMFRQAQARYGFDAPCSWMVGDKETDIVFGRRAGCAPCWCAPAAASTSSWRARRVVGHAAALRGAGSDDCGGAYRKRRRQIVCQLHPQAIDYEYIA
jgi:FMN phosphatase YigB (HAD superfamily)